MNILSLDLGTTTGWAVRIRSGAIISGSEKFSQKKGVRRAHKWILFKQWLSLILTKYDINAVYYEEVMSHTGIRAAHCYGAFEAFMEVACAIRGCQVTGVGVGTIKKFATGKGNAKKLEMVKAAELMGCWTIRHDEADAYCLLKYALSLDTE